MEDFTIEREKSSAVDRSRRWMLTVPAFVEGQEEPSGAKRWTVEELTEALRPFEGAVFQLEAGSETGYQHFQTYLENDQPVRFEALKKRFPSAHLEAARKPRQACVAYCSKPETRILGPFWVGELRLEDFQGKRNDLEELREAVLLGESVDDLLEHGHASVLRVYGGLRELEAVRLKKTAGRTERTVTVEYHWGATGTGKTRGVFEKYGYEAVYRIIDYRHGALDQYAGEPVLFLDEFDSQVRFTELLGWLDRYPLQVSGRYRNKWAAWTTVILASNKPLSDQYAGQITDAQRAALERRIKTVVPYFAEGGAVQ